MSKILIVYGTKEGQTAKIAQHIGDVARQQGHEVDVNNAREIPTNKSLNSYSAILVGSSVHAGNFNSSVLRFVRKYKSDLDRVPSAFFTVSLSDSLEAKNRGILDKQLITFYDKTGWHPKTVGRFAGAVAYTKYGFFIRYMMKWMSQAQGYPTDTSRDHEFTDWDQVTEFANAFMPKKGDQSASEG